MANAKFIDAATWASLPEIDVTNGEDLFPQLAAGTYRPVLSGVDSAVIPALTAGAIVQATPTVGDTLTVSGSNATGSATFQWQRDTGGGQADISGATSATYDTTGQPEGDYRRGVSDGVQGPVYTAAVTVAAVATVPAAMSAPTVTAVSDTEISVDRAAAPSDGGSAILSYDLRYEVSGSGSWTTVTGITDPQTVTGLTASTLYNAQTRAVNAVGAGAWSASGSATTDAAAGLDFVDDFTGYALGSLLRDQAPYTSAGANQNTIIADSGGVRVARQPGGLATLEYTASTVAADREVSVTVKTLGQQNYIGVYLSYIDANNYTWMTIGATGALGFLQKVAGANGVSHNAPSSVAAGDKFTLSRVGTSLTMKRNGVQVGPTATLAAEGASTVRITFNDAASPSSTWEISKFEVKDL